MTLLTQINWNISTFLNPIFSERDTLKQAHDNSVYHKSIKGREKSKITFPSASFSRNLEKVDTFVNRDTDEVESDTNIPYSREKDKANNIAEVDHYKNPAERESRNRKHNDTYASVTRKTAQAKVDWREEVAASARYQNYQN